MKQRTEIPIALVVAIVALLVGAAGLIAALNPPEPDPILPLAAGDSNFTNLVAEDLTLSDDLTVGDDLAVTDDATITGKLNVDETTTLDSFPRTVTNGMTLTVAYSMYHLNSAGAVTMTLAACDDDGQLVVLFGDDANNIIIADTNVRTSTGAALTLGQYDVAAFVCNSTEWIELWLLANS